MHFFTFILWDDWTEMSEKTIEHVFQNHNYCVFSLNAMCLLTAWMTSKTFWNQFWSYRGRDNMHNCVNNKMLEYMWPLTALLSGLINCFKSELQEVHLFTSLMNLLSWRSQVQIFWGFTVNFFGHWTFYR